jgi:DNA-binding MarR family transcriptional regulator
MHLFEMYLCRVDALDLYLLGRRLARIGETALQAPGTDRVPPAAALVLGDVLVHPGSSITEITERTGFPQSYVSKSVGRLREAGLAEAVPDPADGRRTLVRPTPAVAARIADRAGRSIGPALADALGPADASATAEVTAALQVLVDHLVTGGPRGRVPTPGRPHPAAPHPPDDGA